MRYTGLVSRKGSSLLFLPLALLVALMSSRCGGGNALPTGPSPVTAAVEFDYVVAAECLGLVHLHPSWWGFAQVNMADLGSNHWAILFESVPVGHHKVRIEAPPECGTGAVSANGAPLTDRVAAKRGIELGFTVNADGSVTP
jgi:hypothetical protein